jgi:hypothetical protein
MDYNIREISYQNDRQNQSQNCDTTGMPKVGNGNIDSEANFVTLSERNDDLYKNKIENGSKFTKKEESLIDIHDSTPHDRNNNNAYCYDHSSTLLSTSISSSTTLSYAVNTGISSGISYNDDYIDNDDHMYLIRLQPGSIL